MKIVLFLIIFSLTSFNVLSAEKSMNSLLQDGFIVSKEETKIAGADYKKVLKIYTLKKKKEMYICSITIDNNGLDNIECFRP
jgi:hypothetical protein